MSGNHSNVLHFDSLLLPLKNDTRRSYPLYPYHSIELVVSFVYGTDFTRHMNILLIPESVQLLATVIMVFMLLAAIVLCIIRKKFKLERNGFVLAFIDTLIAIIAGGNIRMNHKFERWFFGILLIGAFFITSLFAGDLVDCIIRILNQKISTFDQLAGINAPIYTSQRLSAYDEDIHEMLRFVLVVDLLNSIENCITQQF